MSETLHNRVPAGAQRSGSRGKRTNSGESELSPQAEARDTKLVRTQSRLAHQNDSQKTVVFCCFEQFFLVMSICDNRTADNNWTSFAEKDTIQSFRCELFTQ